MYLSLRCFAGDRLTLVSSVVMSSKYIPASGQMTEKCRLGIGGHFDFIL